MEQDTGEHDVTAEPDGNGILVSCTCGWQVWSRTSPSPATLRLAEAQIGGKHLANVNVPLAPAGEVLVAIGVVAFMVLMTAVVVYVIVTG